MRFKDLNTFITKLKQIKCSDERADLINQMHTFDDSGADQFPILHALLNKKNLEAFVFCLENGLDLDQTYEYATGVKKDLGYFLNHRLANSNSKEAALFDEAYQAAMTTHKAQTGAWAAGGVLAFFAPIVTLLRDKIFCRETLEAVKDVFARYPIISVAMLVTTAITFAYGTYSGYHDIGMRSTFAEWRWQTGFSTLGTLANTSGYTLTLLSLTAGLTTGLFVVSAVADMIKAVHQALHKQNEYLSNNPDITNEQARILDVKGRHTQYLVASINATSALLTLGLTLGSLLGPISPIFMFAGMVAITIFKHAMNKHILKDGIKQAEYLTKKYKAENETLSGNAKLTDSLSTRQERIEAAQKREGTENIEPPVVSAQTKKPAIQEWAVISESDLAQDDPVGYTPSFSA